MRRDWLPFVCLEIGNGDRMIGDTQRGDTIFSIYPGLKKCSTIVGLHLFREWLGRLYTYFQVTAWISSLARNSNLRLLWPDTCNNTVPTLTINKIMCRHICSFMYIHVWALIMGQMTVFSYYSHSNRNSCAAKLMLPLALLTASITE